MRLAAAVDTFINDLRAEGRINSKHTEDAYRAKLYCHADDVKQRDPAKTGRGDVKRTLLRWPNPNSQRQAHAILTSFYDWAMEEGLRKDNPARQVRRAKAKAPSIYRLTRDEVIQLMDVATGKRRDRWVTHLGLCAGLRSQEIRGLQGHHFARPGWVWVSEEIAKGRKERWMPVTPDLEPVVQEILTLIGPDEYVIPGRRYVDPPHNTKMVEDPTKMLSAAALYKQVRGLGESAGIAGQISPHTLRHAFGDHVAKYAGLRAAQALMGHASVETTAGTYTDRVSLDELAVSVQGFSYRAGARDAAATPVQEA